MAAPLLLGSLILVGNMVIQIVVMLLTIRYLIRRMRLQPLEEGFAFQTRSLVVVVFVMFIGHLFQFAIWAGLFVYLGEFSDYATAFYHSGVNFTSLGYGDIVMSQRWRLLGPLEAANGVMMFGLSAGAILSIMSQMFSQFFKAHREKQQAGSK